METKTRKVRKIQPYTRKWEKLANELARCITFIIACKHCGYPVVHGYCCTVCGSDDPS